MKNLFAGMAVVLGLWVAGGREAQAQISLGSLSFYSGSVTLWVDSIVSIDTLSAEETRVTVRVTNGTIAIVDFWTPTPQAGFYYLPPPMSADSRDEMLTLVRAFQADRGNYWTLQFRALNHWSWAGNFYDACKGSETYLEVIEPMYLTATFGIQGGMNNVVVRGSGSDFGELEIMRAKSSMGSLYYEVTHIRFLRTARTIDGLTYQPLSHAQMMSILGTLLVPRPWIIFDNLKGDYDGYRDVHSASRWTR